MDHRNGKSPVENVTATETNTSSPRTSTPQQVPTDRKVTNGNDTTLPREDVVTADDIEESKKGLFSYLKTRNFYIVLGIGYGIIRRIIPLHFPCIS